MFLAFAMDCLTSCRTEQGAAKLNSFAPVSFAFLSDVDLPERILPAVSCVRTLLSVESPLAIDLLLSLIILPLPVNVHKLALRDV